MTQGNLPTALETVEAAYRVQFRTRASDPGFQAAEPAAVAQ
jgi:hypothetical protein